jgi:hypothetical protein
MEKVGEGKSGRVERVESGKNRILMDFIDRVNRKRVQILNISPLPLFFFPRFSKMEGLCRLNS